jgi:arylformamidase
MTFAGDTEGTQLDDAKIPWQRTLFVTMRRLFFFSSAFLLVLSVSGLSQDAVPRKGNRPTVQERFDLQDTDKDGVLTLEEIGRPRLFRRLDADGDGVVTSSEAAAFSEARSKRRQPADGSSEPPMASEKDGSGMTEDLNVPYAHMSGVDPNLLSLDIYRPKDFSTNAQQTSKPVVVMIHGGGWRAGDKGSESHGRQKASFFTGHGFVYVSVNYRLSPEVQHPAHVEDVAKALSWIFESIGSYGGDPNQIFLMGHSAGAHLAALVTADKAYLSSLGKSPAMLSGVILLDSAGYDIRRLLEDFSDGPLPRPLYEGAFGKDRQTWIQASPIQYVQRGEVLPPFLVFYTEREISKTISKEFVEALHKAQIPAAGVLAKAKSHRTLNQDIGRPADGPSKLILEFLQGRDPKTFPPAI